MLRVLAAFAVLTAVPVTAQQAPAPAAAPPHRVALASLATLDLPDGWRYLAGKQGQDFLVKLGNPRNTEVLGVAVCDEQAIFTVFFYRDEGHIKDDDVADLDYAAMLADMQAGAREGNSARQQQKLATVELLGWADPPHYDAKEKKLYYAERLQFSDSQGETINYFVRVLGRSGVLEMNAVGGMEQLADIAKGSKELLAGMQFVAGNTYHDFDPAYDKIAAYGIGGLIAGKLLLKVGLFAGLLKVLAAAWKPIAIGLVAVGGACAKLLGRRKQAAPAPPKA